MVFILLCLSLVCSVVILHVSYGIYSSVNRDMLDAIYGEQDLWIDFEYSPSGYPTKGELMEAIGSMDMAMLEELDTIALIGWFPGEVEKEGYDFDFNFRYSDGQITCMEQIYTNLVRSHLWKGGSYFTNQQYQQGELVAIAGTPDSYVEELTDYPYNEKDGYVTAGGKRYRCIGKQDAMNTPMIPFTTVEDDFVISWIIFGAKSVMKRSEYIEIYEAMHARFPDVPIPEYPVPSADDTMMYKSIMLISVLIAVLSALTYAVLYQYIMDRRKRTLDIFRVSGLTLKAAGRMYLGECMLILVICYGVAFGVFKLFVFPRLASVYCYMEDVFSNKIYIILGVLYFGIVYAILRFKLVRSFQKTQMIEHI